MNSINSYNTDGESNYCKMAAEEKNHRNSSSSSTKNRSHAEGSFASDQHQSTNTTTTNANANANANVNEIVSGIVLPIVAELKELQNQLTEMRHELRNLHQKILPNKNDEVSSHKTKLKNSLCESKVVVVASQPKSNKRAQPDQEQAIPDTVVSSSSKRSKVTASSQTSNNDNNDNIMKDKLSTTTTTTTTSKNTQQEQNSGEISFNCFPDDILHKILEFEGKRSYIIFGLINKRCNIIFKIYKILKLSFVWGYGPLKVIQERKKLKQSTSNNVIQERISKGIHWYKRMDVLNWLIEDAQENEKEHCHNLYVIARNSCKESSTRYDILHEIFDRVYGELLINFSRSCGYLISLAAQQGDLELIKWLRQYNTNWCSFTWCEAKEKGHDHVLQYLKDNDYPKRWQKDNIEDIDDYYDSD